jgi:hypothetical protein
MRSLCGGRSAVERRGGVVEVKVEEDGGDQGRISGIDVTSFRSSPKGITLLAADLLTASKGRLSATSLDAATPA